MRQDIDGWIAFYNNERAHSGRFCFGKTPMQTWQDSKSLAQSKDLNNLFGQNTTFKESAEAQTGSAEVQSVRNTLTDGNEKATVQKNAASQNSFLSKMP